MNKYVIMSDGIVYRIMAVYYESIRDGIIFRIEDSAKITRDMLDDPHARYELELSPHSEIPSKKYVWESINQFAYNAFKPTFIEGNFDPKIMSLLYVRK